MIWFHALAIGYSPEYLTENADGIRQDFPRIPLPANRDYLFSSVELGRRVAWLLDTETEVEGVTAGDIAPELRTLASPAHIEGRQLSEEDFKMTAGWGHAGKGGVTMPGKGKIEEGDSALDIYLNNDVFWRNVPRPVWDYYIGGYQVVKKWLSYREYSLLGRALTIDEVREVTNMVRRIAGLIAIQDELDENYMRVKTKTFDLPK